MTRRQVWRYKCDYCKRANCSSAAIQKHERACTNNPNRVCGMCASVEQKQKPLVMLIEVMQGVTVENVEGKLEQLKQLAECPVCTLAALRQSHVWTTIPTLVQFDYKAEVAAFWKDYNDNEERIDRKVEAYGL